MTEPEIREAIVSRILASFVKLDFDAGREAFRDATAAEEAAAASLISVHMDLYRDRSDRVLAVYKVAAPYLRAGAATWGEVIERMTDQDLERFVEATDRLWPGDMGTGTSSGSPAR